MKNIHQAAGNLQGRRAGQRQAAMMSRSELYLKSKSLELKCIWDSAATSALGVNSWQSCSAPGTCFPGSSRHLAPCVCSLVSETDLVCQQHLPALRSYSHMSIFTKKEMKTHFLHVLPKANQEFIAQHGLKPQNTSCTTTALSTDFFCLHWLHQALLHIETKMSFEALDLLLFKPVKCPEIAPVLVLSLPAATLLNLHFVFFCTSVHPQKMQQDLGRSSRVSILRSHKDHGHICFF